MNDVNWVPAISVLAAGLVIGAIVLWRVILRGAPSPPRPVGVAPLERRDLEGRYEALIGQLRELDDTGAKRNDEQIRRERHALEQEAARVLRAVGRHAQAAPATPNASPVPIPAPANAALRGFLWGVGSVGALGLLFFFVSQSAKQRPPEGSLTGNTPMRGASPGEDTELAQARSLVERRPEDVEARLELVRLLLIRQDMMAVFDETQAVLQRSPGNPRALAYQALVRMAMGQAPKAESMLKEALKKDPQLLDAHVALMLVYVRSGRQREADGVLADATRRFPKRAESLRGVLAEMRSQESEDASSAATAPAEDPHAGVAVGGAPAAPGPRGGAGEKKVTGVLELDASLEGQAFAGGIVFVTLREGSFGAGPPLAARRIPAGSFPMPFEIGASDSMTGEVLPDDLLVEARIDSDGDPITRPPSDPYGRARVPAGSKDVRVALKRRPPP